jgi:hypothetical protein
MGRHPKPFTEAAMLNLFDPQRYNCLSCVISSGPVAPNDFGVETLTAVSNVNHIAHNRHDTLKIVFIATKIFLSHKLA